MAAHYTPSGWRAYEYDWYGWLRHQLYIQELALLGVACLAGGFVLTSRTIVADVRARRNGPTAVIIEVPCALSPPKSTGPPRIGPRRG